MDDRIPSCEASLLYTAPGTSDPARLADDIREIVAQLGMSVAHVRLMEGIFLHFDCGPVQLLLALCDEPLPIAHFLEATRPTACMADEHVILQHLTRQTSNLTVIAFDSPADRQGGSQASDNLKLDLCWDVTEHLSACTRPDLVFWGASDTLYTVGEFHLSCDFLAAQACLPRTAIGGRHGHLRLAPKLPPKAAEWLLARPVMSVASLPDPGADPDAELNHLARENVALGLVASPGRWTAQRAMRSLAMACCGATIGLSGMSGLGGLF